MRSIDYVNQGSTDDFVNVLSEEVLAHPVVNHEYLTRLAEGDFKDNVAALKDYAHQYSFYSMLFPEYVKSVMDSTNDPMVIEPLEENLVEELGDENATESAERPHTEIFREFKGMIGIDDDYKQAHEMSLTVGLWRDLFLQKCKSKNTAVGVGAISLATEYIVPHFYPHIINCIENHTPFGKDESFFFRLHVDCDEQHAEDAIDVAKYLSNLDIKNREALRFGVFSSINLRHAFWDNQLARALSQ